MNSRFIIIAILIFIKVIGVASHARAESYFPVYCSLSYSTEATSYKYYWGSTSYKYYSGSAIYRCGQSSYSYRLN